jgi:hypothetical protein
MLKKNFSPDHDVRYTVARLRRYATNLDAQAISEADLTLVADLAAALERLPPR